MSTTIRSRSSSPGRGLRKPVDIDHDPQPIALTRVPICGSWSVWTGMRQGRWWRDHPARVRPAPPPTLELTAREECLIAAREPLPFDPVEEARRHWVEHGWDDTADGMVMVTSITRVQQILQARIDEVLRPLDLTFARYEVLMLLSFTRHGQLPLNVIGARLQVHPASVTSAVDRLEAQGYVERQGHPTDRRTKLAVLTDLGRKVAAEGTDRLNERVFAELGLSQSDLSELHRILTMVRRDAGDF